MNKLMTLCFITRILMNFKVIFASTVNITNFKNCDNSLISGEEWPVEILTVSYEKQDNGFVDTVHGTYVVRTIDKRQKEVVITIFKCPIDHVGVCNSNRETYVQNLLCNKFSEDDTGPWHMISTGMSGAKCGESTGTYELKSAQLRPEYLHKYFKDINNFKYRIQMLFHKKDESIDDVHIRGCVIIDFSVIE